MLFKIHREKLLQLISPHPFYQQGSPCCEKILTATSRYHSKVTLISALYAKKIAKTALLVFYVVFQAPPL